MGIGSRVSDLPFPEGGERDALSAQRRVRIEERRAFHEGRASADDIRKRPGFIDLEPIEPVQTEIIEDEAAPTSRIHRGTIINIRI